MIEASALDVVLIDAELQDGGALEVCNVARQSAARPRLVVLASVHAAASALELFGAEHRLDKPFSGRQLLALFDQFLASPEPRVATSPPGAREQAAPTPPSTPERPSAVGGGARGGMEGLGIRLPEIPGRGSSRSAFDLSLERIKAAASNNALAAMGVRPMPGAGRPGRLMTIMQRLGTLEATPFPALLYKLFANQSTGILTVHRSGSERVIYFEGGEPVYAVSNSASDSLGAILVNMGFLKLDQLNTVLEGRVEGQPLGQSLLQMRLLTSEQLLSGLERQVYDRVLSCFSFTSGQYIFTEDTEWVGEVKIFRQNPIQLIFDGVNRFVGPNVLATHLQAHLSQYVVRTEKFEHFKPHLSAKEASSPALALIDGSRTLNSLTREVGGDLMALLRLVWALRLADMVDFLDTPRTWAERSPDKPPLPSRPPTDHGISRAQVQAVAEAAGGPDPAEAARKALETRVLDYYVRLGYENHWQLLGLTTEATPEQAREAFRQSLEALPPEQFDLLGASVKEKAVEVHEALKKAFNTISEPGSRSHYLQRIQPRPPRRQGEPRHTPSPPPAPLAQSVGQESSGQIDFASLEAESQQRQIQKMPMPRRLTTQDSEVEASQNLALVELRRAREAAAESRWRDAWHLIKRASRLTPDSQEIVVFQTWVIYNLPHDDRERQYKVCRSRIELELSLDSGMPDAHFFLGRMCEDHGELRTAIEHYRAANLLDPRHPEALSGLERLRLRASAEPLQLAQQDDDNLMNRLKGWFKR